jgi:hypothetical protein
MNATAADGGSVGPILVGIDGSSSAPAAARWAADEAGVRQPRSSVTKTSTTRAARKLTTAVAPTAIGFTTVPP